MTPAVLLFTLCTVFAEPRAGQVQAKRLGEDAESGKICSHVYFLLAGTAAVAADRTSPHTTLPGFCRWS